MTAGDDRMEAARTAGWREGVKFGQATFQREVAAWVGACFGPAIAGDMIERADRFLEEALELAQSIGYDMTRAYTLVDYVAGRPAGEPDQEVGGTMVTLAAFCATAGLDMQAAADRELARISDPAVMEKIRRKQAAKADIHGPTAATRDDLGFVDQCEGGPGRTSIRQSHRAEGRNFVD